MSSPPSTHAGFQPIAALANLEGLLNSLADPSSGASDENAVPQSQLAKAPNHVQHQGALGFLQGFLKLQQAMQAVHSAQNQSQACYNTSFLLGLPHHFALPSLSC